LEICLVADAWDSFISRAAAEKLPAPATFVKTAMLARSWRVGSARAWSIGG
jgi:hypothetical protein